MLRGIIFGIVVSLMAVGSTHAATIYVPDDYPTVQAALDASVAGDTVIVRDGTWKGAGNRDLKFNGKAVTLASENGPANCIIDCEGSGRGFYFGSFEPNSTVVDGVTITNGNATDGGGIFCWWGASPSIINCIIDNNSATSGGGVYYYFGSKPVITNCTISNNSAVEGGGLYSLDSWVTVNDSTISNNSADAGGGLYIKTYNKWEGFDLTGCIIDGNTAVAKGGGLRIESCRGDIIDCTFTGNTAEEGGGMYFDQTIFGRDINIVGCVIEGNTASGAAARGGGIYSYDFWPIISSCLISNNVSDYQGGGIYCIRFDYPFNGPTVENCIICGNSASEGGGIAIRTLCEPLIKSCTISGNSAVTGGGIYNPGIGTPNIWNSILWNDTPDEIVGWFNVAYSDIEGGWTGTGNIDVDPLFADLAGGDFHLTLPSPCKDTGDNAASGNLTEDFEGDPRVHDGTIDMGADEFHPHLYCMGDVIAGYPIEVKVVGIPPAPVTLALGSGIQDPPQSTPYGDLHLAFPLTRFNLGSVPATGVLSYPATVPPSWQSGDEYPFQALVGPIGNPASVLTNLMVMTVE